MKRLNLFVTALEDFSSADTVDGGRIIIARDGEAGADFNAADKLDINPQDDTIIMKGPLGEMFTQALNVMYSKTDPVDGSTALESFGKTIGLETQAMDYVALRDLKEAMTPKDTAVKTIQVYGVAEDSIEPTEVVDITKQLSVCENPESEFYFVFDGTGPEAQQGQEGGTDAIKRLDPEDIQEQLVAAVEGLAAAHNCKIFHGLESFLTHIRIKK